MREIKAGVTKGRILAATVFLVIATAVLLALGVEPGPYLMGVAVGIALVGGAFLVWKRTRPTTSG